MNRTDFLWFRVSSRFLHHQLPHRPLSGYFLLNLFSLFWIVLHGRFFKKRQPILNFARISRTLPHPAPIQKNASPPPIQSSTRNKIYGAFCLLPAPAYTHTHRIAKRKSIRFAFIAFDQSNAAIASILRFRPPHVQPSGLTCFCRLN